MIIIYNVSFVESIQHVNSTIFYLLMVSSFSFVYVYHRIPIEIKDWIMIDCFSVIVDVTDSLVCYSCQNCNDPFQSTYVYGQWLNDTQTLYCTVSKSKSNASIHLKTKRSSSPFVALENITGICDIAWDQF